jgi:hypothetical protein
MRRLHRSNHIQLKNQTPFHFQHSKRSAISLPTCCRLAPLRNIIILYDLTETQSVHGLEPLHETLPIELFFRILDFLEPHEYSGLSCTCRYAVTLVNRKLDNPKEQKELWFGFDLNESRALNKHYHPGRVVRLDTLVTRERRNQGTSGNWSCVGGSRQIALARTTVSRTTTTLISDRLNSEWTLARSTSCHPN